MKTCDVCGRTNEGGNTLDGGSISSVLIGTDIRTARVGVQHEAPIERDLCSDCNEKINASIDDHLKTAFGLRIRG